MRSTHEHKTHIHARNSPTRFPHCFLYRSLGADGDGDDDDDDEEEEEGALTRHDSV